MGKYNLKPGDKFGRLTITGERETRNKVIYEKCICKCGNIKRVSRYHLVKGKIRSCGCLMKEVSGQRLKEINTKHGMFGSKFYSTFMRARGRCNNPNDPSYYNYGGRGIKFLWDSFEKFYEDMYPSFEEHLKKYGAFDTSLDRIDVNGDYCKENCRRATYQEQQNNRRDCVEIIYKGIKFPSIVMFAEYIDKPTYVITQRLSRGRLPEEIADVPIGMNRHQYYKDDKYKPMPIALKIKYRGKIYPSIKDFCLAFEISYNSYSNQVHRGISREKAIEALLNKKFNTNDNQIDFVN